MRLDQYLAQSLGSRTRAADAIKAGRVKVNEKTITRPAFEVDETDTIDVSKAEHDYVSRAGGKLQAAFDAFDFSVEGEVVLDIGASTGGFTQCSLEHGARQVYALDVGHLQLSDQLKNDPRVVEMEGVNVKDIRKDDFAQPVDFICMDVSFISAITALRCVFEQFVPSHLAVLVKPQFECGPKALNKKGVIKHPKYEKDALDAMVSFLKPYYSSIRSIPSPVVGRKGNQEYIVYAQKRRDSLD